MGLIERFSEVFDTIFSNPERRSALLITIAVSVGIVFCMSFDRNRLTAIFYKQGESLGYNVVNFFSVMSVCFLFGYLFSKLQLWVRSGSLFQKEKKPPSESDQSTQEQKPKSE